MLNFKSLGHIGVVAIILFYGIEVFDSFFCFFVPIKIYENADIDKVQIFADNRDKLGVYRWINNENGNTYVGSSVNLSVRFYSYFSLRSLAKSNRPIDRALLKYGFSSFSLEILEYCDRKELLLD